MFTDPDTSIDNGRAKAYKNVGARVANLQRSQYPMNGIADICYWGNGVGCDGGDCSCGCHSEWAPLFNTNEEVEEWHND